MSHTPSIARATAHLLAWRRTMSMLAWSSMHRCQHLICFWGHDCGINSEVYEICVQMAAIRAASSSPVDELTTPSPFSSSRDDQGAHTAPQGGAAEEGSSEKKPFLRRRPPHMPVSQRCCCNFTRQFTCKSQYWMQIGLLDTSVTVFLQHVSLV